MTEVVIVTTLWKRHDLERLTLRRLRTMASYHEAATEDRVHLIAAGSEGDASRSLAEDEGWQYIEHDNTPLGAKHNALIDAARLHHPGFDVFMVFGSDDWMADGGIDAVLNGMRTSGAEVFGPLDCYFVNCQTAAARHWPGYLPGNPRHGEPAGCGRMYAREALERVGWALWNGNLNRGLDRSASENLRERGVRIAGATQRELGVRLVDLKSRVNIWRFHHFGHYSEKSAAEVLSAFPDHEGSALRGLWQLFPELADKVRRQREGEL